jgi:hypothetical protein
MSITKNTALISVRPLEELASEIKRHSQEIVMSFYNIGKCLIEAKQQLTVHGEWSAWLEMNTDISERDAQRFMRIADAFPKPTALSDLGSTKAYALATLPPKERKSIMAKKYDINGCMKNVREMTTRELEDVVRQCKNRKKSKFIPNDSHECEIETTQKTTMSKKDFHAEFKYLTTSVGGMLLFADNNEADPMLRDDIYAAIREFCERTLKQIPKKIAENIPGKISMILPADD